MSKLFASKANTQNDFLVCSNKTYFKSYFLTWREVKDPYHLLWQEGVPSCQEWWQILIAIWICVPTWTCFDCFISTSLPAYCSTRADTQDSFSLCWPHYTVCNATDQFSQLHYYWLIVNSYFIAVVQMRTLPTAFSGQRSCHALLTILLLMPQPGGRKHAADTPQDL